MKFTGRLSRLITPSVTAILVAALGGIAMTDRVANAAVQPSKVDLCKLITTAEAQSALGMPVSAGAFQDDNIFQHCTFRGTVDTGSGKPYVTLSLMSSDKQAFDRMSSRNFERATGTTLDAYFYKASPWVTVWHNGYELQVQISFSDEAGEARAKVEELKLANIAVTRF